LHQFHEQRRLTTPAQSIHGRKTIPTENGGCKVNDLQGSGTEHVENDVTKITFSRAQKSVYAQNQKTDLTALSGCVTF
jgi:hypothetical protein